MWCWICSVSFRYISPRTLEKCTYSNSFNANGCIKSSSAPSPLRTASKAPSPRLWSEMVRELFFVLVKINKHLTTARPSLESSAFLFNLRSLQGWQSKHVKTLGKSLPAHWQGPFKCELLVGALLFSPTPISTDFNPSAGPKCETWIRDANIQQRLTHLFLKRYCIPHLYLESFETRKPR